MSKSGLVSVNVPAYVGNYTKGRSGRKIECIAIHHMAGVMSAEQCGSIFKRAGRNGSSHYGIGISGEIGQYVDENDTAWTNNNWDSNCKSVTIEVSNSISGGEWLVGDVTLNSLIKLVADIAKRNNITLIKGVTVVWHRMFCATTCPGNYLLSKMDYIIAESNRINTPLAKPLAEIAKPLANITVKGTYITLENMKVRAGAGTEFRHKLKIELSLDGQRNCVFGIYGTYKKGTDFTALEIVKGSNNSIWARTPSGYICIRDSKYEYCRKV